MTKKALVIGGTGPTGPFLLEGLLGRGYEVAIFHRGVHEPEGLPEVEHIHGDPHFGETIAEALFGREFDLVLATYGRVRLQAEVLAGRCARFISVGGAPALRGQQDPGSVRPFGLKAAVRENDPMVEDPAESKIGHLIAQTERDVFALHRRGAFSATHFRYPIIYGPRGLNPREWSVLRRLRDGRRFMIVPDHGLLVRARAAARNAAHAVLLAVDRPAIAAGQTYHCADDEQFTLRQWYELMVEMAGGALELVSLPEELASPFHGLPNAHHHMLMDTAKIRAELGYRDVIAPREALRESLEWWRAHPLSADAAANFPDRFAYGEEDRVVAAYRSAADEIRRLAAESVPQTHQYAHPRAPGGMDHRGR